MKIEINIENILNLMDRPAFCVTGGVIQEANQAARSRLIAVGTPVSPMICAGRAEYDAFASGCLYLTLSVGGERCGASVSRLGEADVFVLDSSDTELGLRAFALAAQELRQPLSQVMAIYDQLFPELETLENTAQIARMNRSLHQLLRIVGNMSDARNSRAARMELLDVTAVMQEIMDHAAQLCEGRNVTLSFSNHPASIHSLVDSQKLERAVYNLLSNALKYTAPGGRIDVQLKRRGNSVFFTVTDTGSPEGRGLSADAYTRFLREPGLDSSPGGLGLGLTLVLSAARAHEGVLLLDQTADHGVRATLSFPIRQNAGTLRSPAVRFDYAGERDHGLIELAESLPYQAYSSKAME